MPVIVKIIVLCILCIGLITGIVYLIKWFF